jgi:Tfp pilus assembly protein PilF
MKIKNYKILLIIIFFSLIGPANAENTFFTDGKNYFNSENYKKAKISFEKDIVFNPKSEKSYLYLAKIFNKEKKAILEENNLKTVLLLNPKNEEAIYFLAKLSIEKSDFLKASDLIKTFDKVCNKLCSESTKLKDKLKNSSK